MEGILGSSASIGWSVPVCCDIYYRLDSSPGVDDREYVQVSGHTKVNTITRVTGGCDDGDSLFDAATAPGCSGLAPGQKYGHL
jgi:hypothetical protein